MFLSKNSDAFLAAYAAVTECSLRLMLFWAAGVSKAGNAAVFLSRSLFLTAKTGQGESRSSLSAKKYVFGFIFGCIIKYRGKNALKIK